MALRPGLKLSAKAFLGVVPDPRREFGFGDFAGGNREHGYHAGRVVGEQSVPVELQKQLHGYESCSLVPVHKGMVSGDAITIGGSEVGYVRLAVSRQVLGPSQGRLKQSRVPQSCPTSVFGELGFVYCHDDIAL